LSGQRARQHLALVVAALAQALGGERNRISTDGPSVAGRIGSIAAAKSSAMRGSLPYFRP